MPLGPRHELQATGGHKQRANHMVRCRLGVLAIVLGSGNIVVVPVPQPRALAAAVAVSDPQLKQRVSTPALALGPNALGCPATGPNRQLVIRLRQQLYLSLRAIPAHAVCTALRVGTDLT